MKEFLGKIRPPKNHIPFQSKCLSPFVSCFLEFLQVFSKYLDYRKANLPALLHLIDRAVDLHNLLENQHPDMLLQCVLLFIAQPLLGLTSMFLPFCGNGIKLLLIHQFYSRIFSEKLCPCLDGIYGSIPFPRIFVLVCKRYRVDCFIQRTPLNCLPPSIESWIR